MLRRLERVLSRPQARTHADSRPARRQPDGRRCRRLAGGAQFGDPSCMEIDQQTCLTDKFLAPYIDAIRLDKARPRAEGKGPADTVWMGVIGVGALQRWPHDGLRHDGQRRPAANPGRGLHPLCGFQALAAAGDHGTTLVALPHLGSEFGIAQTRKSFAMHREFSKAVATRAATATWPGISATLGRRGSVAPGSGCQGAD